MTERNLGKVLGLFSDSQYHRGGKGRVGPVPGFIIDDKLKYVSQGMHGSIHIDPYQVWNNSLFSGFPDAYLKKEGLLHGGVSGAKRRAETEFGSGWQVPRELMGQQIDPRIIQFREDVWDDRDERRKVLDEIRAEEKVAQAKLGEFQPDDFHTVNLSIIEGINRRRQDLQAIDLSRFVSNVEDADSLVLRRRGIVPWVKSLFGYGTVQIRLSGIDAPEVASHGNDPLEPWRIFQEQPGGEEATEYLSSLVEEQGDDLTAIVAPDQKTYGRYLGTLATGSGENIALRMLREGVVTALPFGPSSEDIISRSAAARAEDIARETETGLWDTARYQAADIASRAIGRDITWNTLTRIDKLARNLNLGAYASFLEDLNDSRSLSAQQRATARRMGYALRKTHGPTPPSNRFSGRDDAWNTIEGLPHGGMGEFIRRSNTDFGSGFLPNGISRWLASATVSLGLLFNPIARSVETKQAAAASVEKMFFQTGVKVRGYETNIHGFLPRLPTRPVSRQGYLPDIFFEEKALKQEVTYDMRSGLVSKRDIRRNPFTDKELASVLKHHDTGHQSYNAEAIQDFIYSPKNEDLISAQSKTHNPLFWTGLYAPPGGFVRHDNPNVIYIGSESEKRDLLRIVPHELTHVTQLYTHGKLIGKQLRELEADLAAKQFILRWNAAEEILRMLPREEVRRLRSLNRYTSTPSKEFGLNLTRPRNFIPGFDDAYNTIEGLPHESPITKKESMASILRKKNTDFGSGWRGLVGISGNMIEKIFGATAITTTVNLAEDAVIRGMLRGVFRREGGISWKEGWRVYGEIDKARRAGWKNVVLIENPKTLPTPVLKSIIRHERIHQYARETGQEKLFSSLDIPADILRGLGSESGYKRKNIQKLKEEFSAYVATADIIHKHPKISHAEMAFGKKVAEIPEIQWRYNKEITRKFGSERIAEVLQDTDELFSDIRKINKNIIKQGTKLRMAQAQMSTLAKTQNAGKNGGKGHTLTGNKGIPRI